MPDFSIFSIAGILLALAKYPFFWRISAISIFVLRFLSLHVDIINCFSGFVHIALWRRSNANSSLQFSLFPSVMNMALKYYAEVDDIVYDLPH